jgi:hypothetical protein
MGHQVFSGDLGSVIKGPEKSRQGSLGVRLSQKQSKLVVWLKWYKVRVQPTLLPKKKKENQNTKPQEEKNPGCLREQRLTHLTALGAS